MIPHLRSYPTPPHSGLCVSVLTRSAFILQCSCAAFEIAGPLFIVLVMIGVRVGKGLTLPPLVRTLQARTASAVAVASKELSALLTLPFPSAHLLLALFTSEMLPPSLSLSLGF